MGKRIYAEDAIDALGDMVMNWTDSDYELGQLNQWKADRKAIIDLPSAQPETHDKRTETHACDDAISREDAKWAVFCNRDHVEDQANAIDSLPCVQPQRIKGRWVRKESDLSWWYECSVCGESPLFDPYENEVRTPFCPWCGADMRGEEDG